MFKPLEKFFSLNCPFYADKIIILALDLFAVTATSFSECFQNFKLLRELD